jgi:hypothetical protein
VPDHRDSDPPRQPDEPSAHTALVDTSASRPLAEPEPEPPIVARLVIEIRSDGRRTIARGAAEDRLLDQKVAVQAEGTTPLALAMSLAKSLVSVPSLAKTIFAGMLTGKKKGE